MKSFTYPILVEGPGETRAKILHLAIAILAGNFLPFPGVPLKPTYVFPTKTVCV